MALYGKALANQVPASTTGNQARIMFGAMTAALSSAYGTLANYDSTGIAQATGLDAGSVDAARSYLDSCNQILSQYFPSMPISDIQLDSHQLAQLKTAVSTSSVAVKTIDDLFGTPWLQELCDAIVEAAATVTATIANTVSKVGGSFVGGTWWIWLLLAVGLVLVTRLRNSGGKHV